MKSNYSVAPVGASPFKTQWNSDEFPVRYETNYLASVTIPDQTMSIRTIMDRFARGLPIDGEKVPVYNGEDADLPNWKALDLAEQEDLMLANAERIRMIRDKLQRKPAPMPPALPEPELPFGTPKKEPVKAPNESTTAPV